MVTWVLGGDNLSPLEVDGFRTWVAELFSAPFFAEHVRSIRRDESDDGLPMIVMELDQPAEVINDDGMVLAVLEELHVPVHRGDKAQAVLAC